ncbi:hypothetical protein ABK040_000877 [Willaertia magna]
MDSLSDTSSFSYTLSHLSNSTTQSFQFTFNNSENPLLQQHLHNFISPSPYISSLPSMYLNEEQLIERVKEMELLIIKKIVKRMVPDFNESFIETYRLYNEGSTIGGKKAVKLINIWKEDFPQFGFPYWFLKRWESKEGLQWRSLLINLNLIYCIDEEKVFICFEYLSSYWNNYLNCWSYN